MNLNQSDRTAIAEYIYSYKSDVLIKADAIAVIDVLFKHKLIDNPNELKADVNAQKSGIAEKILSLINDKIPETIGMAIMKAYYGA